MFLAVIFTPEVQAEQERVQTGLCSVLLVFIGHFGRGGPVASLRLAVEAAQTVPGAPGVSVS